MATTSAVAAAAGAFNNDTGHVFFQGSSSPDESNPTPASPGGTDGSSPFRQRTASTVDETKIDDGFDEDFPDDDDQSAGVDISVTAAEGTEHSSTARRRKGSSRLNARKRIEKCPQCPVDPKSEDDVGCLLAAQEHMHLLVDHPNSTIFARVVQLMVITSIILSTAALIISTVDSVQSWSGWSAIETAVSIFFTVELILRFLGCKSKVAFAKNPMNFVDFIAILPFYLDLAIEGSQSSLQTIRIIRIVRLVRIFRLLKVGRYMKFLHVFKVTLKESSEALVLLLFFVMMAAIVFGSIVATIESGTFDPESGEFLRSDGSVSPFTSIPRGIYWALTTLTTVGYGDMYPVETGGRMFANIAMIFGILVFALPLAVIGSQFQSAYDRYKSDRMKARRRKNKDSKEIQNQLDKINEHHEQLMNEIEELMLMTHSRSGHNFNLIESHWKMHLKVMDTSVKSITSSLLEMMNSGMIKAKDAPGRPSKIDTSRKVKTSKRHSGSVNQSPKAAPALSSVQLSDIKEDKESTGVAIPANN
jgi:voltage-gated potassium channel Kch